MTAQGKVKRQSRTKFLENPGINQVFKNVYLLTALIKPNISPSKIGKGGKVTKHGGNTKREGKKLEKAIPMILVAYKLYLMR